MKKTILLLLLALTFGCDKDDDNNPGNPVDQLPTATQTGAQTFGCLIDGKAFVPPKFGSNAPNAFYQFVGGAYTLGINAATGGGTELKSINIGCLDMPIMTVNSYTLKEFISGNYFGEYRKAAGFIFDGSSFSQQPGNLVITRFDPVNFIISGTFNFKAKELSTGEIIEITEGRFDMQYTN
ncbi:hypothetical protein J2X31_002256 [Flavobacterium arsenatis]|uniref:Lipoprotein n=1 Tax=Flavobacterium arsenatis TaxID=1484332 RepID=A0ABU1TQJ7_9FLAO|nr:hypothetical protein [Flavobacterium arsenatis]MDR6968239.1 hypothetical protein [Flavobacterium arsenatis]